MSVPDDEAAELANDLAIANAQVKWMEAVIERMTGDLKGAQVSVMALDKEIERLRAALKEISVPTGEWQSCSHPLIARRALEGMK